MQTSKLLPEDIENQLKHLNIDYILYKHDPLHTMADLEEKLKLHHALPIKNLFYEDRKGINCYLIIALKDTVVEKAFWKKLGTSNRKTIMGKSQTLQDVLGVEPGSVTPFGLANDVNHKVKSFIIDHNIMKHDWVSFHP
jgi:Ala-tRNA(Pro) deacylase